MVSQVLRRRPTSTGAGAGTTTGTTNYGSQNQRTVAKYTTMMSIGNHLTLKLQKQKIKSKKDGTWGGVELAGTGTGTGTAGGPVPCCVTT